MRPSRQLAVGAANGMFERRPNRMGEGLIQLTGNRPVGNGFLTQLGPKLGRIWAGSSGDRCPERGRLNTVLEQAGSALQSLLVLCAPQN